MLFLGIASGCSEQPKTYLVHGMVVFPDGKPLTKGTVEFEVTASSKPITATGAIGLDGTFELGTYAAKDGAIVGQHRVVVIADHMIGTGEERPEALPPPVLDPKYHDYKTSGLTFTVKPEVNNILIEVAPPPAKSRE